MSADFHLDPRLEADSVWLADGPLSQLRMMDDARFDWLVLVPRVLDVSELIDLNAEQQRLLLEEINHAGVLLRACSPCDKLNIGILGNIVRQLHVHVLARVQGDCAWPGPAWGAGSVQRLDTQAIDRRRAVLGKHVEADFWRPAPL